MPCLLALACVSATAGDLRTLPPARQSGGKPLMQTLKERRSDREFANRRLPEQTLSNLLWAAYGVNRPDGRRTAPSAMNRQLVDVYVVLSEGAYRYDPKAHALDPISTADLRAATGTQDFAASASVNLIYVADLTKVGGAAESDRLLYAGVEAGAITQNVYLFCASEHLATVVRASVNRESLSKTLQLRPEQRILLAQSVGFLP